MFEKKAFVIVKIIPLLITLAMPSFADEIEDRAALAQSQYLLGVKYYSGENTMRDISQSLDWLNKAALSGNMDAQFMLGEIYYDGKEVFKDYREALKWFTKAAENGDKRSQLKLGLMYYNGEGAVSSYTKAYTWFSIAAKGGEAVALNAMNNIKSNMTKLQIEKAAKEESEIIRKFNTGKK